MAKRLSVTALPERASYAVMLTAVTLSTWAVKGVRLAQAAAQANKKEQKLRQVVADAISHATDELGAAGGAAYVASHAAQVMRPNAQTDAVTKLGAAAIYLVKDPHKFG